MFVQEQLLSDLNVIKLLWRHFN